MTPIAIARAITLEREPSKKKQKLIPKRIKSNNFTKSNREIG